ncbi:MAG: TrkH family potassium uptake protein [Calditrichia bacterium]
MSLNIHFRSVINILGLLLMFMALTMLLPLPFSFYYDSGDHNPLIFSAAITFFTGLAAYYFSDFNEDLRPKEGFAIVTFSWIGLSLFGSLPFILSGAIPDFTNAFFETISGFSTTGATILSDIESLPRGILFWRSLTHWIGGMGIIVLSLAILPFLGVGGMQLFKAEVPGPTADKLAPKVADTAKMLWGVYVLLTGIQTSLLMFGGMDLYDSLCHAFGTMATGGYSTQNTSVAAYSSAYIDWVIIFFMIIAGSNFSLHYRMLRGNFKAYFQNVEFKFYLGIIALATLIISFDTLTMSDASIDKSFRDTLFQVVSIITTTGFATADYEDWSFASQAVLFFLMFTGACAGSTSGGMKLVRIYLLIKFVLSEIVRLIHPHAVVPVRIGKTVVNRDVMQNIIGYFILFIMIYSVGVLIMTATGLDIESSFGAVAATLGNVGPGLGSIGPTDNYAHISVIGKWVLSFLMLVGRLEVFTVIILFSPSFWQK